MRLTNEEKETVILFNEKDYEAEVYTYNGRLKRRLTALCEKYPEEFSVVKEDKDGAMTFRCPKKRVHISNPIKTSNFSRKPPLKQLSHNKNNVVG